MDSCKPIETVPEPVPGLISKQWLPSRLEFEVQLGTPYAHSSCSHSRTSICILEMEAKFEEEHCEPCGRK